MPPPPPSPPPSRKHPTILDRCKKDSSFVIILLALLRILICFWPQTGYLHPDEFFQSVDIVAGKHFGTKIEPVWEFQTDEPIRCMLLPSLLNGIAFKLAKLLQPQPSAYLLLVVPRLIYTLASFSIDYCLLLLCRYQSVKGLPYFPISFIYQSSFVCLGIFTRTLSNTTEAILFAWLLVVVCRVMRPITFRIVFVTPKLSKPVNQHISRSAQITSSLLLGFLGTLATFNRPTFPCFALVPCIYWLFESFKRNSKSIRLLVQRALMPLIISSLLTFAIVSCYDTIYYKDQEIVRNIFNDLLKLKYEKFYTRLQKNWVITPYNFIAYNTNLSNLSKYGIHKPYTHLLVNMPLAFNLLAMIFYRKLIQHANRTGLRRLSLNTHRIQTMMLLTTLVSLLLMSLIPHQEFRFLAPIIIPLVYVCAPDIFNHKKLLSIWLTINLLLIYFYARIHQSGVTNALLDLDLNMKNFNGADGYQNSLAVSVIATKCYPVPTYTWSINDDDDRFYFNLGNSITDDFYDNVNEKLKPTFERFYADVNSTSNHKLIVLLPRLYVNKLSDHLTKQFESDATIESIRNYSLHFSGEDFGEAIGHIKKYGPRVWKEAFGFSLVQINLNLSEGGE